MSEDISKSNTSGFFDVFISKLKEQSFIIILMLGVIYYQNGLMNERVSFWQNQFEKQQNEIELTTKEDKQILLKRVEYLQDQRDKYVEESLNDLKNKIK
jgi:hypothetical protein